MDLPTDAFVREDAPPVVVRRPAATLGHDPDPMVVQAMARIRDRFGAHGLRDLIALAQAELDDLERQLAEFRADLEADRRGDGVG